MLYLIGGPSRSGKTLLARKLLELRRIPYFCADYLTSGLEAGVPSLGVGHDLPSQTRGELAWPVLAAVLRNLVEVEPEYLVEGDALLELVTETRAFSEFLEAECRDEGLRSFDGSDDFALALDRLKRTFWTATGPSQGMKPTMPGDERRAEAAPRVSEGRHP